MRLGTNAQSWGQKLLLHARPENNKPYAGYQESYRDRCRDLRGFLLVHGCFDGAEFCHFFLLVIVEIRVDESNYSKNQEDDSENDDKALHSPELITSTVIRVRNASRRSPAPDWRRDVLTGLQRLRRGWLLLRQQLSWRPWLRWKPCGDAWSSAESRALRRSIRRS